MWYTSAALLNDDERKVERMRRIVFLLILFALALASCGGTPADTTVPNPPNSTAFEKSESAQVNQIVEGWKSQVPAEMKAQQVKDPIEEKVYQSTASLQEIADFYKKELTDKNWIHAQRMPGVQNGILVDGYDIGSTTLVIGAVDASQLGGSGVVVYTAKGTK